MQFDNLIVLYLFLLQSLQQSRREKWTKFSTLILETYSIIKEIRVTP